MALKMAIMMLTRVRMEFVFMYWHLVLIKKRVKMGNCGGASVDLSFMRAALLKIEPDWIKPLARGLTDSQYSDTLGQKNGYG